MTKHPKTIFLVDISSTFISKLSQKLDFTTESKLHENKKQIFFADSIENKFMLALNA